ncbi:MAG TPA: Hpt domain-containing protein [Phycisphaerales bacterium]|nr:Hpt domain-containing protein [Phycisphaerales bacterium]
MKARKGCVRMVSSDDSCGGGRAAKWKKLLVRYLRALPAQVEEMGRALDSQDMSTVGIEAHRIKGTAGTYGLAEIAETADRIEVLAESQEQEKVHKDIERLAQLVQLRISELQNL